MNAKTYTKEIDRYYLEEIHKKYNCYMATPMIAIQREGYSDIEGCEVNYNFMQKTLEGLRQPEHTEVDGNYVLKLPQIHNDDLPKISIITPTYDRRNLFPIAINNFDNFNYPKEKIEWIIVDDTPDNKESIEDLLPIDTRIKYYKIKGPTERLTISYKRNLAVSKATSEYIVHMDDDDYYPPESLLSRIKSLIKYEKDNIRCVGCTKIGVYDIINDTSSLSSDSSISLSEATMAYTKSFWRERQFDSKSKVGEHKYFTETRLDEILDIPYSFVIIAMNHKGNFTGSLRSITDNQTKSTDTGEIVNFYDTWDVETQMFMCQLSKLLKKA